ncbi:hypothetical protein M8A51_00955 [Schlegelella sp. S2-27]|uniref:Uncharacterized protein n=1 Tax=Caldimonas mangrovi TaxID=2944811 RepID=A0ABT0YH89_9BURK|nr:hypothetical protein [Caldimonas mangrovi]MCM5678098.1 hypothetical protein [Caldimonas mangrovi]
MDYIKEIERIQREQEQAIRAAQAKAEQTARAALAGGTTAAVAAPAPARPASRAKPPSRSPGEVEHAATRALSSTPPAVRAFAARVARRVLLIPVLVALAFVVEGAMGAWDGYYLHPGELVAVVVPLLIIAGLLKLRARLADPQSWTRVATAPGMQAAQGVIGRWVVIVIVLIIASAVLEDVFPGGLPVGQWLGWPAPPSSPGV